MPFNGSELSSKLLYKLHFADNASFLDVEYADGDDASAKATKNSAAKYVVNNIRLKFTKIKSNVLSSQVKKEFGSTYTLLYDRVHYLKTFPINTSDQLWNWSFSTPVKSLRGILLIGKLDSTPLDYNYEVDKYWNMGIKKIHITIEGVNNLLYDKGMNACDIYDEAQRFWSGAYKHSADIDRTTKELKLSEMVPSRFYDDKYCVWIDLRCVDDNHLHGSGLSLTNNSEGITLAINRESVKGEASGVRGKVHAYLMMDASTDITENNYGGVNW